MKNFYYFVTGLKDLPFIDEKVLFEYTVSDLIKDINLEIPKKYSKVIYDYLLYFDNINLINLLSEKKDFYNIGNFNIEELNEIIKEYKAKSEYAVSFTIPTYWNNFILNFIDNKREYSNLLPLDELLVYYYKYIAASKNTIFKKYIEYDFNLKNLAAAINCKKYKIGKEDFILPINEFSLRLVKEQSYDAIIKEEFDLLTEELSFLEKLNILELELKLDYKRIAYIDELTTYEYFSIDKILAYLIKLSIVERWTKIDVDKGIQIFNSITNNIKNELKKND